MARLNPQAVMQERAGMSPEYGLLAPIGGLNTRDDLASMPGEDAEILENWMPGVGSVKSRNGHSEHADSLSGDVETLMWYKSASNSVFMAASGSTLYTIPSSPGGSASSLGTGYSNARWQWANFGGYITMVNGEDAPQNYEGTTLATPTFSGDLTAPEDMNGIHSHKNRLYMWDDDTSDFYYGGTDAIQGAFSKFSLKNVSRTGGNLIIMNTISVDSGSGPDDFAVFVLDTGEALVYQGSNPGDAADWALVGRFTIPAPISVRSGVSFGGDVMILTENDFLPLTSVAKGAVDGQSMVLEPSKLSGAIRDDFALYGANYGWQAIGYGKGRWLVINVPVVNNDTYIQYVINTVTGAATKFTGMNARCFGIFENDLYFGGDAYIYKADDGTDDDGANINLLAKMAPSTLGVVQDKQFINHEIYMRTEGNITAGVAFAVDYGSVSVTASAATQATGAQWDVAEWDVADWAGATGTQILKFKPAGVGTAIAAQIAIDVKGQTIEWFRSNYGYNVLQRR